MRLATKKLEILKKGMDKKIQLWKELIRGYEKEKTILALKLVGNEAGQISNKDFNKHVDYLLKSMGIT